MPNDSPYFKQFKKKKSPVTETAQKKEGAKSKDLPKKSKQQLMREQKAIVKENVTSIISDRWNEAMQNNGMKIIIHTGGTNSGKTYNAILDLKKKGIVGAYLAPLRLLASEIFDKLNSEDILCSLYTGEEKKIVKDATIRSSTIEMFNFQEEYDVVVIDECQMISDPSRGAAWTHAILKVKTKVLHLIVAPHGVTLLERLLLKLNRNYTIRRYQRISPLKVSETHNPLKKPVEKTIYVVFSRLQVLELKQFFESKNIKVSCLYGNLPPEVKRMQSKRFLEGETQIAVATDCLGMGLNLPADRVVFVEIEKFDGLKVRPINASEVQQIGGRAGRYGLSECGYVSAVNSPALAFIKQKMEEEISDLHKAMIAPELEELEAIPKNLLHEKLSEWKELRSIPKELKDIIEHVYLDEKIELAKMLSVEQQQTLGLSKSYLLCMAPIIRNITEYWRRCAHAICHGQFLPKPNSIKDVKTQNDIVFLESCIKEHELYMWLGLRKPFEFFANDMEGVWGNKYTLIDLLDKALMNFTKMKRRQCVSCGNELPTGFKFKICQSCYDDPIEKGWD